MLQTIAPDGTVYIEVAFDKDKEKKRGAKQAAGRKPQGQPTEYARVDFNRQTPGDQPQETIYSD